MADALFYVDALPSVGELGVVDGDEGFHAANVRRTRPGEKLDLSDGAGGIAHCVIEDVGKGTMTARVLRRRTVEAPTPRITVVQALPKSDRSELAIELATEAGADAFVAWQASRCVGALGRAGPRRARACVAGARWPARPRGSRGGRTSRRSAGWCRRRSLLSASRASGIDPGARAARVGGAASHRRAGVTS